jgi:hypothetical protein
MTPFGFVVTFCFALVVLCSSRRMAVVGMIAPVCYITEAQVLNVAGFHFTSIRFVLLAGLIRVIARGELRNLRLNTVDKAIIAYAAAALIISTFRVGTLGQLTYQIGVLYNVGLSYFLFRLLLRDEEDYRAVLAKVAYLIVPFALLMVLESVTGRNLFSVFGGVMESSWVRDEHVRSQGPFRNPITAGAFGATFAMLFVSILFARGARRSTIIGLVASLIIVSCARSSGPFLGLGLGLVALACWPLRRHTLKIWWGFVAFLVGLQIVMKAPIWFLIGRASDIVGGGGYHRAYLIEQFVNRFSSWWFAGVSDTSDWFPYQLADGQSDITNMFVAAGVDAGLLGVILCVVMVICCFQRLGIAMRAHRGTPSKKIVWGIGSTLVGSVGILFSVTYFDQTYVMWYFFLACIGSLDIRKRIPGKSVLRYNEQGDKLRGTLVRCV